MSTKKLIITIGIFLIVVGIVIGVILYVKSQSSNDTSDTIGVRPTPDSQFSKVTATALPVFSQVPGDKDGWVKKKSLEESGFGNILLTNSNSCMIDIQSQLAPYVDKSLDDFALSKAYAETVAQATQGELSDIYIIKVQSSEGDIEFYAGTYTPTIQLTSPGGTTPSTTGGSKDISGTKTFVAVRSIASPIQTVDSSTSNAPVAEGVIALADSIPTIVIKYECQSNVFRIEDGMTLIRQLKLDLNPSAIELPQTTTGK